VETQTGTADHFWLPKMGPQTSFGSEISARTTACKGEPFGPGVTGPYAIASKSNGTESYDLMPSLVGHNFTLSRLFLSVAC